VIGGGVGGGAVTLAWQFQRRRQRNPTPPGGGRVHRRAVACTRMPAAIGRSGCSATHATAVYQVYVS